MEKTSLTAREQVLLGISKGLLDVIDKIDGIGHLAYAMVELTKSELSRPGGQPDICLKLLETICILTRDTDDVNAFREAVRELLTRVVKGLKEEEKQNARNEDRKPNA